MKINFSIIEGWEERAYEKADSFLEELLAKEESQQVQTIAAEFPNGTAIDEACILITKEGLTVLAGIDKNLTTANEHIKAITAGIASQLANAQTGNKKGFARFLAIAGAYLQGIASSLTGGK